MICINPTAPDAIGFTTGAGLPGDVRFDFKTIAGVAYPNVAALYPQLVLRPFTTSDVLRLRHHHRRSDRGLGSRRDTGLRDDRPLQRRGLQPQRHRPAAGHAGVRQD